jgi:hypothetical protein
LFCLGCAINVLRGMPGVEPVWFRDLIRSRYDRICFHLDFGLDRGSFRCECECGDRQRRSYVGAGIANDRLICEPCLDAKHARDGMVFA